MKAWLLKDFGLDNLQLGETQTPQPKAGELLVKGPNIFQGYWNKPELNKDTFTEDGWYKTGDVFYVCPKGNYYITDRMKELIKYSTCFSSDP